MKVADIGGVIWLIIFVMVFLAKGWSKLQKSIDDDSSKPEETPSAAQPKPPRLPPGLQPRPAAAPITRGRGVALQRRTAARATPRTGTPSTPGEWKVSADDIRRFVEQLAGKPQPPAVAPPPPPPPIARPPTRRAKPSPAPMPEPAVAAPVATQPAVATPAPAQSSRASQWMEALRDRNNIRNIVIAAEIIGPPKAESV
jgi:hypothetical protein